MTTSLGPELDAQLNRAIRTHVGLVAHGLADESDWHIPERASGQCGVASWRVVDELEKLGIYAEKIQMCASGIRHRGAGVGGFSDHWAAYIPKTGQVVDLTARQFEPLLPFPWITDLARWSAELEFYMGPHDVYHPGSFC